MAQQANLKHVSGLHMFQNGMQHAQVATRHTIIQLCVKAVILATTISAAILWVLWRNTDSLYTFLNLGAISETTEPMIHL